MAQRVGIAHQHAGAGLHRRGQRALGDSGRRTITGHQRAEALLVRSLVGILDHVGQFIGQARDHAQLFVLLGWAFFQRAGDQPHAVDDVLRQIPHLADPDAQLFVADPQHLARRALLIPPAALDAALDHLRLVIQVKRGQQLAQPVEHRADECLLGLAQVGPLVHFARQQAAEVHRDHLVLQRQRIGAVVHMLEQEQRHRNVAHGVVAQYRDCARHGPDRPAELVQVRVAQYRDRLPVG